jgi:lycopene elongase/hydratase (dihydrobisanhydrobacterioruberin-forming)
MHELDPSAARVHSAAVVRRAPVDVAVAVWRLSRPGIWLVSVLPLWTGHLLATRELVPTTVADAWRFGFAIIAMGPLGWVAASAINDVHDLDADRHNPRKVDTPLVRGVLSPVAARVAAYASAALMLGTALAVGPGFAMLTGAVLALAWAYSVPPARLKTRPGADVASNALAVGVLPLLAGWSVARPLVEFPWWFMPQSVAVAVALYVPTTLVDLDADRAAGQRTVATRLGRRAAYRLGSGAWILGAAGTLVLAAADTVIPRSLLGLFGVFLPVLVLAYHLLIGRAATSAAMVRGIVLLSLTFLVPSTAFALAYTGLWQP